MIDTSIDFHGNYMWPFTMFTRRIDEVGYNLIASERWSNRELDLSTAKNSYDSKDSKSAYYEVDGGIFYIASDNGEAKLTVAAKSREILNSLRDQAKQLAPEYIEKDKDKVEVTFWSMGAQGPEQRTRSLDVPDWDDIEINYPNDAQNELGIFMNSEWRPSRGGQLMLWYGPPGTGKTTALRALAREWRGWCDMHYIADPEVFFGSRADYMMNVMINGDRFDDDENKWRLLILEDCGELLKADARMTSGQGLSRLLNSVDGLIGQGLRFMVLVTTNEDFGKLHPAVTRPGRCLAQIEFDRLKQDEVRTWLEANHVSPDEVGRTTATLAELYAEKEGFINKDRKLATFGFNQ